MPFNIDQMVEDERTLLGESLIGEAGTVDEIAEIITRPEMFLDPDNRTLWRAVLELNAQGIKPDIVVVSDQLGKAGKDDLKRWQVFAVTLSEAAVSTANVKYHAQVVREAYIRRSLATIGKNMATEASEDKITSPAVLAEESQKAIENVLSGLSGQESYDALGMIDEVRSEWNRPSASPIVTGIQCLDLQLGGLMPGEVFVLAARPSVGKTSFGLTVGLDVATNSTHGGPVAFVSVEMTRRAMMTRLVSLASRIPAFRL